MEQPLRHDVPDDWQLMLNVVDESGNFSRKGATWKSRAATDGTF